jgi:hypothetical protein
VVEVKTQLSQRDFQNLQAQVDESHFTVYKTRRCFIVTVTFARKGSEENLEDAEMVQQRLVHCQHFCKLLCLTIVICVVAASTSSWISIKNLATKGKNAFSFKY